MNYRDMINQDFQEAPLTESQLGEQAGIRSYNEAVAPYNKAEESGRPLRKMYSPESEEQMKRDAEMYQESQPVDEQYKFESPQSNMFLQNLGPDGAQSLVNSLVNGRPEDHISFMTQREVANKGVSGAQQTVAEHAGINRNPAGFFDEFLAPPVQQYQAPQAPSLAQGGVAQVDTTKPYIVPTNLVPTPAKVDTTRLKNIGEAARGSRQDIEGLQESLPQMATTQKKALQAKGIAQQEAFAGQYLQEGMKQAYLQKYADSQMQSFMDIANKQYDINEIKPDRVWDNKSSMSKAALVLGTALLGSRGSNAGLQVMQNMIEKDIDAQKDKNLNERSLIAKNYEIMRMLGTTHAGAIKAIADSMGKQAAIVQQAKLAGANLNEDVLNNQVMKSMSDLNMKLTDAKDKALGTEKAAESEVAQTAVATEKMRQEALSKNIDIKFKQLEASNLPPQDVQSLKSVAKMHDAKERIANVLKTMSPADKMQMLSGKLGLSYNPELDRATAELINAEVAASGSSGSRGKEKYEQLRNEFSAKLLDSFKKNEYNSYLMDRINKTIKENMRFSKDYLADPIIKQNYPELMQYKVKSGSAAAPAERLKKKAQEIKKGK